MFQLLDYFQLLFLLLLDWEKYDFERDWCFGDFNKKIFGLDLLGMED